MAGTWKSRALTGALAATLAAAAVVWAQTAEQKGVTTETLGGPDRFLTSICTDKPIYRIGENIYIRGVILDASSKAGNAHDAAGSLEAIERAEETLKAAWEDAPTEPGAEEDAGDAEAAIVETLGDCAYGSADNRRDFADAERTLSQASLAAQRRSLHQRRFPSRRRNRGAHLSRRPSRDAATAHPRLARQ